MHGGWTDKRRGGAESRAASPGLRVPGAPAGDTTGSSATRSSSAAQGSGHRAREAAPASDAIGSPGYAASWAGRLADGRWAGVGERGGATVGSPPSVWVCALCAVPAAPWPRANRSTRAPAAALCTEASGGPPRLLAASGRPLPATRRGAAGRRGPRRAGHRVPRRGSGCSSVPEPPLGGSQNSWLRCAAKWTGKFLPLSNISRFLLGKWRIASNRCQAQECSRIP